MTTKQATERATTNVDALYVEGRGYTTCGSERCAGNASFCSGMTFDVNGAEIYRVTRANAAKYGEDPKYIRCEVCGARLQ